MVHRYAFLFTAFLFGLVQEISYAQMAPPTRTALQFDGVADQLVIMEPGMRAEALLPTITNTFTVEAWVNPTTTHEIDQQRPDGVEGVYNQHYLLFPTNGDDKFGSEHAGMGISVGTNGVSVYEHAGAYMPPLLVWEGTINSWTHLAVVYRDRTPTLYINGELKATGIQGTKAYVHPSLVFGGDVFGYFQGQVAELRIWQEARSAANIQQYYNKNNLYSAPALVGYWHLSDGAGTLANDATAGQRQGNLTRGKQWTGQGWSPNAFVAAPPGPGPQWVTLDTAPPADEPTGPTRPFSFYQNFSQALLTSEWATPKSVSVDMPQLSECGVLTGGKVFVQLDSGPSHGTGKTRFTTPEVVVQVTFSSTSRATAPVSVTRTFSISEDIPEMQAVVPIPAGFILPATTTATQSASLTVSAQVLSQGVKTGSTPPTQRVSFRVEPEYFIRSLPQPSLLTPSVIAGNFEQTLSWAASNPSCELVRNYQLQVMHRPVAGAASATIPDEAEWAQQGLLLETGSSAPTYRLTLAEGEGTYHWRVRALGNLPGGAATPANWGPWSGDTSPFSVVAPNEDLNWIYSRTFSEGGRMVEKLTMANGLQQVRQMQTRLAAPDQDPATLGKQVVATQVIQDYSGRDAVVSLPIPLPGDSKLGYKKALLTYANSRVSYNPAYFDSDVSNTVLEPLPAIERDYYSSSTVVNNDRVPDAEGYPFTRKVFANDGTGRVAEQSGVGAALRYRVTSASEVAHTVRTDYADVAPVELIRVFGPEAPEAAGAYKIVTTDPNGVASVTYQTKDGQTIATALSRARIDSTLLLPLASVPAKGEGFGVKQTITGEGRIIGKPLVLTEPTTIKVDYSVTPSTLAASCTEFYCASCDYQVKLRIIDAKGPPGKAAWDTTFVVPGSLNCSPLSIGLAEERRITLTAGAYRIERELAPLSYYAPPAASNPLTPNSLADHLLAIQRVIAASTQNGKWATIREYLRKAQIADLYAYLDRERFPLLTDSDGNAYYSVAMDNRTAAPGPYPADCVRAFKIPKLSLSCAPPLAPGSSYADELLIRVGTLYQSNAPEEWPAIISKYYAPGYEEAKLNGLLDNLLAKAGPDQSSQDLIRNCWVSLLNNLKKWEINQRATFLDDFLECTGMVTMTTPIAAGSSFDLAHADEQFIYDPSRDAPCFVGAYAQYLRNTTPKGQAPAIPSATTEISFIIREFDKLSKADKILYYNNVYRCVKSAQADPVMVPQNVSNEQLAQLSKEEIESKGRNACEARRTEFQAAIVEQLHRNSKYVEGDLYAWAVVQDANGKDLLQQTDQPLSAAQRAAAVAQCQLDIMAQELVDQCKRECVLTVAEAKDANGNFAGYSVGTDNEIDRLSKAMFNRIELSLDLSKSNAACSAGYSPVPKLPGTSYQRVELTNAAHSIISYIAQVFDGSNRLMAQPNRVFSHVANKFGFQEAYSSDQEYAGLYDPPTLSNVFTYKDFLLAIDFPWLSFEPFKSTPPADRQYFIRMLDDRNFKRTRVSVLPAFAPASDFLLLWSSYLEDCNTCRGTSAIAGEGYKDIEYNRKSNGGAPVNPEDYGRTHYIVRFTDLQTGQPILKNDIARVLQVVTLAPNPTAVPGYADPFSSEAVRVRLALTDGTVVDANVDAQAYNRQTLDGSGQLLWPKPDPGSRMILWKSVGEVCSSANRDYTMCYRWGELDTVTPPADAPVFTNSPPSCAQQAARQILAAITQQVSAWEQRETNLLTEQYQEKCVALKDQKETFTVSYQLGYYHYTLYYYDRAGNLVKTVPPAGVVPLTTKQLETLALNDRGTWPTPAHLLPTTYRYNSLHQLVGQKSPDGGLTRFYYSTKGQLRFSQNAKQTLAGVYSYTKYDALGRITEIGESSGGVTSPASSTSLSYVLSQLDNLSFPGTALLNGKVPKRWQITRTFYSQPAAVGYPAVGTTPASPQRNLQNRVSYTEVDPDGDLTSAAAAADRSTTFYSYDAHGNVEWLVQEQPGLGRKYVRYEYDLISNKVLKVLYQEGQAADQFYHRYAYDGDNRLTEVYTSADNVIWDQDAHYEYYAHGPLKRISLGEDQVQGIDYTYTLQGWLKGINHPAVDPGHDGAATTNAASASDAFGMALGYFPGDYKSNSTEWAAAGTTLREPQAKPAGDNSAGLYNGNIATWTSHTRTDVDGLNIPPEPVMAEQYRYDQLNRLIRSHTYAYNQTEHSFASTPNYHTGYSYDPNGNLRTLGRNGYTTPGKPAADNQLAMDALRYSYKDGVNNQLQRVDDAVIPSSATKYQDIRPDTQTGSEAQYKYDEIGNLIQTTAETGEGESTITWNVYGKITRIEQAKVEQPGNTLVRHLTTFRYDAAGNRIAKAVQFGNDAGYTQTRTTYYMRDAQGNVLATYEQTTPAAGTPGAITLLEQGLYGSSRLGMRRPGTTATLAAGYYTRTLGQKQYELTDHLGNVRAVVSDEKLPQANGTFQPELLAYYNYYPFGQLQPNRYNPGNPTLNTGYRYGYNGKEKDNNGELGLTSYDYGFRIYNPGLGKFLSVDPLTQSYPMLTPYQFASNTPIGAVDLDGKEGEGAMDANFGLYIGQLLGLINTKQVEESVRLNTKGAIAGGVGAGLPVVYVGGTSAAIWGLGVLVANPQTLYFSTSAAFAMQQYGPDIANFIYGAASGDPTEPFPSQAGVQSSDAGAFFRKTFSKSEVVLDFFGGPVSRYAKGLSIDVKATRGFRGGIDIFTKIFKGNKFSKIIADNPYKYAGYVKDASQLLESGGTLTVRGTMNNGYFNKIMKNSLEGLEDFTLIQAPTKVSPELQATFKQSDGSPIQNEIYELILQRK